MKPSTKRLFSALFAGLLVIASFVMIFVAIRPAMDEVNKKRTTLESSERVLREKTEVVENINTLITQLRDELAGLRRSVDMILPEEEELTSVLNQLDGMLRRSGPFFVSAGISIEEPTRTTVSASDGMSYLNFSINLEGDYKNIKEFVRLLETNIRVFEVNSFSISSRLTEEILVEEGEEEAEEIAGPIMIYTEPVISASINARAFFQSKQQ